MHSWVDVSRSWKQNFRTKSWWVPWTQKWHFHVWVGLPASLLGCGFMEWLLWHQRQPDVLGCCLFPGFPRTVPCLVVFLHPSSMMCFVLWLHTVIWQGLEKRCFYVHSTCPCRRASGETWCPEPDRCVLRTDSFDSPHAKNSCRHQDCH